MQKITRTSQKTLQAIALGLGATSILLSPFIAEIRVQHPIQPLTDTWQHLPIEPRGSTLLGISFRSPYVETLGLNMRSTLQTLLTYPFHVIRLGAYWNRIEPAQNIFDTSELDWQIDAAEQAGMQIILCVGALKTFGYPECFIPAQYLKDPLQEHSRITPSAYPSLLTAATTFINRVVERYKHRKSITAWQLEHDAVDPLGVEHSWRLHTTFVEKEAEAIRKADPSRPIMMNGFLPTSLPVALTQWWHTRDQGDSLDVAQHIADIVGIDYYPRHAVLAFGTKTLYLDGSQRPWQQWRRQHLFTQLHARGQHLMVTEGQAEPWEAVTIPPNPHQHGLYSCMPEHVISNYNTCMRWSGQDAHLSAYLFWGAEYWLLRKHHADLSYLQAFARILENA